MCDYTGNDFGAFYPDACCIDGYLWDLDSCHEPGGPLHNGGDIPCPQCNHEAWLENAREDVEGEGYEAAESGVTECRLETAALRYEADRPQLIAWWRRGYEEFQADQKESALKAIA